MLISHVRGSVGEEAVRELDPGRKGLGRALSDPTHAWACEERERA